RAGTVLGTPAYMAPEAARGRVTLLDERCDVFGLGAVLCEVLTGQPPYLGATGQEVQAQAERAELAGPFARLDGCGADPELVQLTRACLAAEREARPRNAGIVAQEVTAYLASVEQRLRAAELARAAEQARTEEAQARVEQERKARAAEQARAEEAQARAE